MTGMFSSTNWNGSNRGAGGRRSGGEGSDSSSGGTGSNGASGGTPPESPQPRIYSRWPSRERFEEIVAEALEEIPDSLWEMIDNVAVMVEEWPQPHQLHSVGLKDPRQLLGLYEGVPLTSRGNHYGLVTPDRITIFRRPIFGACGPDDDRIRAQIRRTVLHEVAHHFGISDERLHELGAY